MSSSPKTALVAYVPTPHGGYVQLFRAHAGGMLWILGPELIAEFTALTRHLPGNDPDEVRAMVEALGIFESVRVLTPDDLDEVRAAPLVVMPEDDVSRAIADRYFADRAVTLDGRWRLRWDWSSTQKALVSEGERTVSVEELDRELMQHAYAVAERSSDWWRQVAALLVKDGRVLLAAFNKHQPSEHTPYVYGDPRSNFEPGQGIDVSSALHAEVGVIAEAAKRGMRTEGCDLYVTTFPCPPCAYACANIGLRRLYYAEGYSRIEGAAALSSKGVEIIRVLHTPSS